MRGCGRGCWKRLPYYEHFSIWVPSRAHGEVRRLIIGNEMFARRSDRQECLSYKELI